MKIQKYFHPKKLEKIVAAMLVFVFCFGLFAPLTVQAAGAEAGNLNSTSCSNLIGENSKFDIECLALKAIDGLLDLILYLPLQLGQYAVTKAIELNTLGFASVSFIDIGWKIVRDVANIFFVFILLWIALATIFDVDKYSAKSLLPKFIISALLINFSLVIGTTIISLSNNIAGIFWPPDIYSAIHRITQPALQAVESIKNPKTTAANVPEKNKQEIVNQINQDLKTTYTTNQGINKTITLPECRKLREPGQKAENLYQNTACSKLEAQSTSEFQKSSLHTGDGSISRDLGSSILAKAIIGPVAVFVVFVLAFLLIVRFLNLIFILVLGPVAFLGMILPSTERWWNEWWENLIKWSFFYPAFTIMFHISITAIDELARIAATTGDDSFSAATLFNSLLAGGFMLGSVIVAQKMGIKAADTAMNVGNKWKGNIQSFAKRTAFAPARWAGTNIKEGASKVYDKALGRLQSTAAGEMPGVRKVIAEQRAQAKATEDAAFKRKYGAVMKGTDESIGKYASALAKTNPTAAKDFLDKMDIEKRRKALGRLPGEEQTSLGQILATVGADHLVRGASNDPRTIVELLNPSMEKGSPEHMEAVKAQFKSMNKAAVHPDFIQNMDVQIAAELSPRDIQQMASSTKGAEAFGKLSQREAIPFSNPKTQEFMNTTLGKAVLSGKVIPLEKTKAEKLQKDILQAAKDALKDEGSEEDGETKESEGGKGSGEDGETKKT
jgi:hypothetical protein